MPFGAFATVMDAVKQSGITNVSIVTQPLETHGSNAEIFFEHDRWGRNLGWSAALHVAVAGCDPAVHAWSVRAVTAEPGAQAAEAMRSGVTLVSTVPLARQPDADPECSGE